MWQFIAVLVIAAYAYSRIPKPQGPKRPGLGDIQAPTADPSRDKPVVFGTVDIKAPNTTWIGGFTTEPIKQKQKQLFGSKKITIGYRILLGFELWLCRGPVDALVRIRFDDKEAWTGEAIDSQIYVNAPGLFGGDQEEGGVQGYFDIRNGEDTQEPNDYLLAQIGTDIPASRGMLSVVSRGAYVGTSRYLKSPDFKVRRVRVRQNGIEQWYVVKAPIGAVAITESYSGPYSIGLTTTEDMAYGASTWVAVGFSSGAAIRYSTDDGQTWNAASGPTNETVWEVVYGSGVFVATADRGRCYSSSDGQTWTLEATLSGAISGGLAYGAGLFIAGGQNGNLFKRTSAGAWSTQLLGSPGTGFVDITYSNGVWLALYADQSIFRSTDGGVMWANIDIADLIDPPVVSNVWAAIRLGGSLGVLTSDTGLVAVTQDAGLTWTQDGVSLPATIAPTDDLGNIWYDAGLFIVVSDEANTLMYSYDVLTWTNIDVVPSGLLALATNDDDLLIVASLTQAYTLPLTRDPQVDLNPAHLIRECLTDPDWGMGYDEGDIDDVAFMQAADTLYEEGLGMSLIWDAKKEMGEFILDVLEHIDGSLYVDKSTGKFVLTLVRADYVVASLTSLDESNVVSVSDYTRVTFGEQINTVSVTYNDYLTVSEQSQTVSDIALVQQQGVRIETDRSYPGIRRADVAARLAERDLLSLSRPLVSCTVVANRDAAGLNIGDPFKLTWPELQISALVMRVQSIAYGDGRSNRIKINCVQDVFDTPTTSARGTVTETLPTVSADAEDIEYLRTFELPYYLLAELYGVGQADSLLSSAPTDGYLAVVAGRPNVQTILGTLYTSTDGVTYTSDVEVDFTPVATIEGDSNGVLTRTDTTVVLTPIIDMSGIELPAIGMIGEELVYITALELGTDDQYTATIGRAYLDTVPTELDFDSSVTYFFVVSEGTTESPGAYAYGDLAYVKVTSSTSSDETDVSAVTAYTQKFKGRAIRPYPPGNLQVNGSYYPEYITDALSLTWAHRDRIDQLTDTDVVFTTGDVGPEAGTTYTVRIYDEVDALLHEETGITDTGYDYSISDELTDTGGNGDLYYDDVSCLLHCDGSNGSTTMTDDGPNSLSFTVSGSGALSTAQMRFGTASYLPGASGLARTTTLTPFQFGSGDFTIQASVYPTSFPATGAIAAYWAVGDLGWFFGINSSGQLVMFYSTDGTTGVFPASSSSLTLNQWNDVAVVRSGSTLTFYLDGSSIGTYAIGTDSIFSSTSPFTVGSDSGTANQQFPGYIDEVRVTKGVARTIIPLTQAFYNAGPLGHLNSRLRFELESVRDGYTSYYVHNVVVLRDTDSIGSASV
jgi:hypothetical protein